MIREGWLLAALSRLSFASFRPSFDWSLLAQVEIARCYGLKRRADLPGALPHVD